MSGIAVLVAFLIVVVLFGFYWAGRDRRSPEERRAAIERGVEIRRTQDAQWQQARADYTQTQLAKKYSARPSSTAPQEVLEYLSKEDFDLDRRHWLSSGWRVASVSDKPQQPGIGRVLGLGFIGALVWKPEAHMVVVYERTAAGAPSPAEQTPTQARNPTDELERLAALHERGALTDDEFDRAKRGILGGD
ncbi:MAG: SHOCT domain-containing protein [Chloroflexota bacterium]|nr:SHOCT domain-containing protein [Chloroflexota bacterium]